MKTPQLKGRHWVAMGLAAFLVVALAVVRRQSASYILAREVEALGKTRGTLEAQRSALIGRIEHDKSRAVLVPLAQRRLGLRLPQDSEITILQDPRPR